MVFRADDNANGAADRETTAVRELARRLVRAELERMGLEKELQVAVREAVQMTVQDAVRIALGEMAGVIKSPDLLVKRGGLAATLNPEFPVVQEPGGTASTAEFSPEPERRERSFGTQSETASPDSAGLYIYGVAEGETEIELEMTGIAGCRVYTLAAAGLCAVVHDCHAEPYRPVDDEQAKEWLFEQQDVLDRAKEKLGTVLPFGFNTIIHAAGRPPQEVLQEWLTQESNQLHTLLERLRDREEYAVKILAPEEALKQAALRENDHLQALQRDLEGKPEGARYLYRERLEQAVREALEDVVDVYFRKVYRALRPVCADIQVEKTRQGLPGARMVANLSCLVDKSRAPELGQALAEIQRWEGFTVDFTGPWPPYSFVGKLAIQVPAIQVPDP